MKYEEKFKKYLDGELSEQESEEIREDMEKMRVLIDHMDVEPEEDFLLNEAPKGGSGTSGEIPEEDLLYKKVSKSIRRKFRNYAIAAASVAIVVVLLIIYGLSPLLNMACYSPIETTRDEEGTVTGVSDDFATAMLSYMELFCGEKGFASVTAVEEGYGKYSIEVQTQISGDIQRYPLRLTRNRLHASDTSWNQSSLPDNAFTWRLQDGSGGLAYCGLTNEEAKEKLAQLPDSLYLHAAVSFKDTKNAQEFVDFMNVHESYYMYAPMQVESDRYRYWGFDPSGTGYSRNDWYDHEKYPYLDLHQSEDDQDAEELTADILEQHVQSLVRYMKDQEEFGEIFGGLPGGIEYHENKYESVLDDLERDGIQVYGAIVFASKEELEDILNDPSVDGVYMMDSRLDLQN